MLNKIFSRPVLQLCFLIAAGALLGAVSLQSAPPGWRALMIALLIISVFSIDSLALLLFIVPIGAFAGNFKILRFSTFVLLAQILLYAAFGLRPLGGSVPFAMGLLTLFTVISGTLVLHMARYVPTNWVITLEEERLLDYLWLAARVVVCETLTALAYMAARELLIGLPLALVASAIVCAVSVFVLVRNPRNKFALWQFTAILILLTIPIGLFAANETWRVSEIAIDILSVCSFGYSYRVSIGFTNLKGSN